MSTPPRAPSPPSAVPETTDSEIENMERDLATEERVLHTAELHFDMGYDAGRHDEQTGERDLDSDL